MRNYYFAPMMRIHLECVMRIPSRKQLADILRACHNRWGASEAKRFSDSLIWIGSYPVKGY